MCGKKNSATSRGNLYSFILFLPGDEWLAKKVKFKKRAPAFNTFFCDFVYALKTVFDHNPQLKAEKNIYNFSLCRNWNQL